MKALKKLVSVLLLIVMIFSLTGCWGKMELNEVSIVNLLGVDIMPDSQIKVTVMAAIPSSTMAGGGTTTHISNVWIGTVTGQSLIGAIDNLNAIAPKDLLWFHTKYIIVGAEYAKTGMEELIDYFIRSRESRYTVRLMVTDGTAYDMMQTPADAMESLVSELDGMVGNTPDWAKAYVPEVLRFIMASSGKNADSLVGRVNSYMYDGNTSSHARDDLRSQYWLDRAFPLAVLEGSTVIKDRSLAGFLDGNQTKGCLWILGMVKKGNVTTQIKNSEEKLVMEVRTANASIKPEIKDNKITLKVKIKVRANMSGNTSKLHVTKEADIKEIEKLWEEEITSEMQQAVEKVQKEYKADVFDFGGIIKRKLPSQWKKIESNWRDIYPEADIQYEVKVIMRRFGTSSKTITED